MGSYFRKIALIAVIVGVAQTAAAEVQLPDVITVLGNVTNAARPVENALVLALNLTNFSVIQTFTGPAGDFRLPPLRSAVYRIIAVKAGFAPVITTVLPTHKDQKLNLQLRTEVKAARSNSDEIWMIRGSLPSDVLRELENVYASAPAPARQAPAPAAAPTRLQTKMVSMTGMDPESSSASMAKTAVGITGEVAPGWRVDFEGRLNRLTEEPVDSGIGSGTAESRGMTVQVQSSPSNTYRIASSRSTWRPRETVEDRLDQADIESHNFEWNHRDTRVQVRYLAQENLFASRNDSQLFELAGESSMQLNPRAQLGVALRLGQETPAGDVAGAPPYRTAAITTTGSYQAGRSVILRCGINSRVSEGGAEWSPTSSADLRLSGTSRITVAGSYKMQDEAGHSPTTLVFWNEPAGVAPRYAYSIEFVSGDDDHGRVRAVGSVTAVDSSMRLLFDDQFSQFWDGLLLFPGDLRRDVSVSYQRSVNGKLLVDVSTSAGSAIPAQDVAAATDRYYFSGALQSLFRPSGTSIEVRYRQIDERPRSSGGEPTTVERINVQMGQSLHLPLDLRVLLGVELARAATAAQSTAAGYDLQRRYLGGVSLVF